MEDKTVVIFSIVLFAVIGLLLLFAFLRTRKKSSPPSKYTHELSPALLRIKMVAMQRGTIGYHRQHDKSKEVCSAKIPSGLVVRYTVIYDRMGRTYEHTISFRKEQKIGLDPIGFGDTWSTRLSKKEGGLIADFILTELELPTSQIDVKEGKNNVFKIKAMLDKTSHERYYERCEKSLTTTDNRQTLKR